MQLEKSKKGAMTLWDVFAITITTLLVIGLMILFIYQSRHEMYRLIDNLFG